MFHDLLLLTAGYAVCLVHLGVAVAIGRAIAAGDEPTGYERHGR